AFASTTAAVADLLWNRARPFVFSTGMPPSIAAASTAAIEVVRGVDGNERRLRLERNARQLRAHLSRAAGAETSPIAPVVIGDDRKVMQVSRQLFETGV